MSIPSSWGHLKHASALPFHAWQQAASAGIRLHAAAAAAAKVRAAAANHTPPIQTRRCTLAKFASPAACTAGRAPPLRAEGMRSKCALSANRVHSACR